MFKKSVALSALAILLAQIAVPVPRANATIGLIIYAAKNHKVGVPMMVTGGVGILPGAPVVGLIAAAAYTPPATGGFILSSAGMVGLGAGIFTALIGLLILDTGSQQDLMFAALSENEAASLGLSSAEWTAFNTELPEINAIRESVGQDLVRAGTPTFKRTSAIWESYSAQLSPDAYEGLKKVSSGIRHSVDKAMVTSAR